jgi:hypothetical protein
MTFIVNYKCILYYIIFYIVYLGSVYVYVYGSVGNIWSRQSKLLAADGATSDYFGHGVSMYCTTAMIGSYGDDDKPLNAGMSEHVATLIQ